MRNYISSILLFVSIQNLLLAIDAIPYMNMISGLQRETADIWTTSSLKTKSIISYVLGYTAVVFLYLFYLVDKSSVIESAIFGFTIYFIADITIFVFFKDSMNYIFELLFDAFIMGFVGFGLSIFIERNYSSLLKNVTPLILLFILSTIPGHIIFTRYPSYKAKNKSIFI